MLLLYYRILGNGLKIQWGTQSAATVSGTDATVNLPISYSNKNYFVIVNTNVNSSSVSSFNHYGYTTGNQTFKYNTASVSSAVWFTIGY